MGDHNLTEELRSQFALNKMLQQQLSTLMNAVSALSAGSAVQRQDELNAIQARETQRLDAQRAASASEASSARAASVREASSARKLAMLERQFQANQDAQAAVVAARDRDYTRQSAALAAQKTADATAAYDRAPPPDAGTRQGAAG